MEWTRRAVEVLARQNPPANVPSGSDATSEFLKLLQNPFSSQVCVGLVFVAGHV
jgi:hypothetical protein